MRFLLSKLRIFLFFPIPYLSQPLLLEIEMLFRYKFLIVDLISSFYSGVPVDVGAVVASAVGAVVASELDGIVVFSPGTPS